MPSQPKATTGLRCSTTEASHPTTLAKSVGNRIAEGQVADGGRVEVDFEEDFTFAITADKEAAAGAGR